MNISTFKIGVFIWCQYSMENIFHRRATRRRGDGIIAAWRPMIVAVKRCRPLSSTQYDDEKKPVYYHYIIAGMESNFIAQVMEV